MGTIIAANTVSAVATVGIVSHGYSFVTVTTDATVSSVNFLIMVFMVTLVTTLNIHGTSFATPTIPAVNIAKSSNYEYCYRC